MAAKGDVWRAVMFTWCLDTTSENKLRGASSALLYSHSVVMGHMLRWMTKARTAYLGRDRAAAYQRLVGSGCEPPWEEVARGNLVTCALP